MVEGQDEINFFTSLLAFMGIEGVQIEQVCGKTNFTVKIPALIKSTGFIKNVKKFALIRDADQSATDAFESLRNVVLKAGLIPPSTINTFTQGQDIDVGIYLMPGNSDLGMLEDLCLKIVQDNNVLNCVEQFFTCCDANGANCKPKDKSKAKIQAYLAAMTEPVNQLGLGAKKGYYNFDSEVLSELKEFLRLFN
jgi:hypothetical protein